MAAFLPYISRAEDFVTTPEARRNGFLEIALRRNAESIPYLEQGKALWAKLNSETNSCDDIMNQVDIREAPVLASGLSVKAQSHLTVDDT